MELRQLRYLVRTIGLGSISQAALDLGIAKSSNDDQPSRIEIGRSRSGFGQRDRMRR